MPIAHSLSIVSVADADETAERHAPEGAPTVLPRTLICVLWPGFLLACLMELLVFALVDPAHLRWAGDALPLSRQGVYVAAFMAFWGLATLAGTLALLLAWPQAGGTVAWFRRRPKD